VSSHPCRYRWRPSLLPASWNVESPLRAAISSSPCWRCLPDVFDRVASDGEVERWLIDVGELVRHHEFEVKAAPDQSFEVTVDVPGRVDVELHHLGVTIATINVR
jgi:hypothetical protein